MSMLTQHIQVHFHLKPFTVDPKAMKMRVKTHWDFGFLENIKVQICRCVRDCICFLNKFIPGPRVLIVIGGPGMSCEGVRCDDGCSCRDGFYLSSGKRAAALLGDQKPS